MRSFPVVSILKHEKPLIPALTLPVPFMPVAPFPPSEKPRQAARRICSPYIAHDRSHSGNMLHLESRSSPRSCGKSICSVRAHSRLEWSGSRPWSMRRESGSTRLERCLLRTVEPCGRCGHTRKGILPSNTSWGLLGLMMMASCLIRRLRVKCLAAVEELRVGLLSGFDGGVKVEGFMSGKTEQARGNSLLKNGLGVVRVSA